MVETRSQKAEKETARQNVSQQEQTSPSINGKHNDEAKKEDAKQCHTKTPKTAILTAVLLIIFSYVTLPDPLQPIGKPTLQHVWYYGWITAISTGLGVLPLVFVPDLDTYWIGISNGIAAGMMVAASYSLISEGYYFSEAEDTAEFSSAARTAFGAVLGLAFINMTKRFLDRHDEYTVDGLGSADAHRALLIFFVMTLHSFSEGVGIGVSFGGSNGHELGVFISASLAVHNIPEGLAIAVVLLPQKNAKLTAALWAIVTSIPQPIMAVPAYIFVDYFIPVLPVGLGFAGGAMAWVALFELLGEAYEDTDAVTTGIVSSIAMAGMMFLQGAIDEGSRT